MQVHSSQIICREGQPSDSIYMVLHGRLRTIRGKKEGGIEIIGEFGRGDCVCELEALGKSYDDNDRCMKLIFIIQSWYQSTFNAPCYS